MNSEALTRKADLSPGRASELGQTSTNRAEKRLSWPTAVLVITALSLASWSGIALILVASGPIWG